MHLIWKNTFRNYKETTCRNQEKGEFCSKYAEESSEYLADEPSTGMDPTPNNICSEKFELHFKTKSKEWAAILTTYYVEEAETVCDWEAIGVSGKLRNILSKSNIWRVNLEKVIFWKLS